MTSEKKCELDKRIRELRARINSAREKVDTGTRFRQQLAAFTRDEGRFARLYKWEFMMRRFNIKHSKISRYC